MVHLLESKGIRVAALRHDPANKAFNPALRQLIHVGYKIAAQMGDRYLKMLKACEPTIAAALPLSSRKVVSIFSISATSSRSPS